MHHVLFRAKNFREAFETEPGGNGLIFETNSDLELKSHLLLCESLIIFWMYLGNETSP